MSRTAKKLSNDGNTFAHVVGSTFPLRLMMFSVVLIDALFAALISPEAVAAVTGAGMVSIVCYSISHAFGIAGSGLIMSSIGARRPIEATHRTTFFLGVSLAASTLLFALLWVVFLPTLELMGMDGETLAAAQSYVPPILLYAALAPFLTALREIAHVRGRHKGTTIGISISYVLNIGLNAAFFWTSTEQAPFSTFDLGFATSMGKACEALFLIFVLVSASVRFSMPQDSARRRARWASFITQLVKNSLPMAMEAVSSACFRLIVISVFLNYGTSETVARAFSMNIFRVTSAWSGAVATWARLNTSALLGEGKRARANDLFRVATWISTGGVVFMIVCSGIGLIAFSERLSIDRSTLDLLYLMIAIGLLGESFRNLHTLSLNVFGASGQSRSFNTGNVVATWIIVLPLVLISTYFGAPITVILILLALHDVFHGSLGLYLWSRKKFRRTIG